MERVLPFWSNGEGLGTVSLHEGGGTCPEAQRRVALAGQETQYLAEMALGHQPRGAFQALAREVHDVGLQRKLPVGTSQQRFFPSITGC